MRIKLILSFIIVIAAACYASDDDIPRIAVYVTGNVAEDEKKALGTRMLATLVNSGRYRGIERSGAFLDELDREQEMQRSGAIDDGQISRLGVQFGVSFICVADITPVYGAFQISARIIDVETAEVVFIGESYSPLETTDDLTIVSDEVVRAMFGEPPAPKPEVAQAPEPAIVSQPDPVPVVIAPTQEPIPVVIVKPEPDAKKRKKLSPLMLTLRVSTGLLAAGGAIGGIVYEGKAKDEHKKYTDAQDVPTAREARKNTKDLAVMRDALYIISGAGLCGFAVTFFF